MPVTIGARPQHGFDEPLGLLSDCHRRIERFLEILLKIVEQAKGGALNDEQRRGAQGALEYFRTAAPRHTADEEQSLFPLLRESTRQDVQSALETVESLEHDHAAADQSHAEIDRIYVRWLDAGSLDAAQTAHLAQVLRDLREMYRKHIAVEDQQVFPLAGKVLNEQQLAKIGKEMADRRGLARS
jgi:hemerythrin-like domain-containing protein